MSTTEHGTRMLNYYPEVIKKIHEFKAITDSEGHEFDELQLSSEVVLNNAYLFTMDEGRIIEWEKILSIRPLEDSSLDDRRETIVARLRGQGKLNTALINSIVNVFTGGTANAWVKDSTLYVEITPPPNNKSYKFANVEQELKNKIPAHLGLQISRNYYTWDEIRNNFATWNDINSDFDKWEDVLLFVPF